MGKVSFNKELRMWSYERENDYGCVIYESLLALMICELQYKVRRSGLLCLLGGHNYEDFYECADCKRKYNG